MAFPISAEVGGSGVFLGPQRFLWFICLHQYPSPKGILGMHPRHCEWVTHHLLTITKNTVISYNPVM